jgi:hypothetical protein
LDVANAEARQLRVYGTLTKRAATNVQLTMYGNLIVDQTGLVDFSRPDGSTWLVQFVVPREAQFVGGGLVPLDSDVGWWVVGSGRVNIQGDPKTPWTRLTGSASAGATSITVQDAAGWRAGDEIAITPNQRPSAGGDEWTRYDTRTITAISGTTITLSAALTHAHPAVTFPVFTNGVLQPTTFTAEVLNLTRTGRIEGRVGLRTHFFMRTTTPVQQLIRYVQFRHLGPRTACTSSCDSRQTPFGVGVLGRWGGPHFHLNGNMSSGSLVEGSVSRDFGAHAFIPHDSNGVTFRANIAHDGFEEAYWWDAPPDGPQGSHHLLLDRNVASRTRRVGNPAQQVTGFWLGHGQNANSITSEASTNVATNNVSVGNEGIGFLWPEVGSGQWRFDAGNLAHNNYSQGIFGWINNMVATVANFVAYYNGGPGIDHGAYANTFLFRDISLYGNGPGQSNFRMQAISAARTDAGLRILRLYADSAGLHPDGILFEPPQFDPVQPVRITDSQIRGYTRAALTINASDTTHPWSLEVRGVTTVGNRYWINSTIAPGTLILDYDQRISVRRFDQLGTWTPQWNARTTPQ